MRKPNWITFTGVDRNTDLARASEIARRFPVEWGVLFSPTRSGSEPRYPGSNTVDIIRDKLSGLSAHLCGGYARRALLGVEVRELLEKLAGFDRIQLNFVPNPAQWPELRTDTGLPLGHWEAADFQDRAGVKVIVQHRTLKFPSQERLHVAQRGYLQYLFDLSGGRGKAPGKWPPHPGDGQTVGYAGGLGPDNVREQVERMNCDGSFWIDMEGRVRDDNDWLDLDKVERVCQEIYER